MGGVFLCKRAFEKQIQVSFRVEQKQTSSTVCVGFLIKVQMLQLGSTWCPMLTDILMRNVWFGFGYARVWGDINHFRATSILRAAASRAAVGARLCLGHLPRLWCFSTVWSDFVSFFFCSQFHIISLHRIQMFLTLKWVSKHIYWNIHCFSNVYTGTSKYDLYFPTHTVSREMHIFYIIKSILHHCCTLSYPWYTRTKPFKGMCVPGYRSH